MHICLIHATDVIRNQGALSESFVKIYFQILSCQKRKEPVVMLKKINKILQEAAMFEQTGSRTCRVKGCSHLRGLSFVKFSTWILILQCQQKRGESCKECSD